MRTPPTMTEPLTWAEILERYPDQWIWLHDIVRPHGKIVTARVVDVPRVEYYDEPIADPPESDDVTVTLSDEPSYTPCFTGTLDLPPIPLRYFACTPKHPSWRPVI